jgi:hypothetical protein
MLLLLQVMVRPTWFDLNSRFAPYQDSTTAMMRKLLLGPLISPRTKATLRLAALVIFISILARFGVFRRS